MPLALIGTAVKSSLSSPLLSFQTKPCCWGNHSELDIYFIFFPHLKSSTVPNSLYLKFSSCLAGYMFSKLFCGFQLPQSTPHPHTSRSMCHHFKTRQYYTNSTICVEIHNSWPFLKSSSLHLCQYSNSYMDLSSNHQDFLMATTASKITFS